MLFMPPFGFLYLFCFLCKLLYTAYNVVRFINTHSNNLWIKSGFYVLVRVDYIFMVKSRVKFIKNTTSDKGKEKYRTKTKLKCSDSGGDY